ncbi:hypothetical protein HPB52_021327 [Rhipicephalus sanguineus]|uniref:Uncharacterized protein n=1 Tax=Rhipicephalus sanguineus TaxID=34632 RepID=A0A9D4SP57_RHISA|nr:hypothetical protein HPB52_021327 [Rhipicephalus sanguineus]
MAMKVMRHNVETNAATSAFTWQQFETGGREFLHDVLNRNLALMRGIPYTVQYWQDLRKELFAMIRQFDAARCGTHGFSLAVVGSVHSPGLFTCASAKTSSANTAIALAAALAIKTKYVMEQRPYILTDAQIACRYFTNGRVPACVARLLGATLGQEL